MKQIRIIKGGARNESPHASIRKLPPPPAPTTDAAELVKQRAAVAVVTGWVSELRQQKEAEAARSYKMLFQEAA